MEIKTVGYAHPDAKRLIAAVQQVYVVRYGDEDITPVDPAEFELPQGLFVVGYLNEQAVACGGWRAREGGEPGLRDGDAELKRMYVVPEVRGQGLARQILHHLETSATQAGRRRLILESGLKQPEALALYESEGYEHIEKFGVYRDSPNSVCMAKPLPVRTTA